MAWWHVHLKGLGKKWSLPNRGTVRHLPGGTEENHENPKSYGGDHDRISNRAPPEYESREFLLSHPPAQALFGNIRWEFSTSEICRSWLAAIVYVRQNRRCDWEVCESCRLLFPSIRLEWNVIRKVGCAAGILCTSRISNTSHKCLLNFC
jgi:hypothetical protein